MKHSYSRRLLFGLGIVLAVALPVLATHSWGGYHWARTANPFTLKIANNMNNGWPTYFNNAVSDWNSASVMNLAPYFGTASKRCAMVTGTVQVCNNTYGKNGWLGLASINLAGGTLHITQGSAKMNDNYFNSATYGNPNEKQHVVCQEIGHTFGLDHQSTDGTSLNTCMDYFSNTGANAGSTASTHPNRHDYDELSIIYAHLDSSTTLAAGTLETAHDVSDVTEDPSTWGELAKQSHNGRSTTYERFNSDGSKTVTHVYWTIEAAASCSSCDHRFDKHE